MEIDELLAKLKGALKSVSLTASEKSDIRRKLEFVVDQQSVPARRRSFIFNPAPLALLITILAGSGTSLAAENSVPGEILYPVKIKVNENIRAALATSELAEAEWEAERLARRLDEAEKLLAKSALVGELKESVERTIDEQSEKAAERIAALETGGLLDGASSVSSAVEASFKAHEKILAKFSENGEETAEMPAFASVALGNRRSEKAEKLRERIEERILAYESKEDASFAAATMAMKAAAPEVASSRIPDTAALGKIGAAEEKIAEVRKFAEKNLMKFGSTTVAAALKQLDESVRLINDSKNRLASGEGDAAFVLAATAERIAQTAKLLLEAQKELKIELKLNGDAEREARDIRERLERRSSENRDDAENDGRSESEDHRESAEEETED